MNSFHVLQRFTPTSRSELHPFRRRLVTKRRSNLSHRPITTASYPQESNDIPLNFEIFDIFDAPSRLGESSKMLTHSMGSSSSSFAPSSSSTTTTRCRNTSRPIEPLPTPVVFDGPAQPRRLATLSYRVGRDRASVGDASQTLRPITSLPDPIIFDGPSRLRPYVRGNSTGDSQSPPLSTLMILLGAAGAVTLVGYTEQDQSRVRDNYL